MRGTRIESRRVGVSSTGLGCALVAALVACGGDPPTNPAASAIQAEGPAGSRYGAVRIARLQETLDLADGQRASLEEMAAAWKERAREPGALWSVAAEIEAILEPPQVAVLAEKLEGRRSRGDPGAGRGQAVRTGAPGFRGHEGLEPTEERREERQARAAAAREAMVAALGLSPEQAERLDALRNSARPAADEQVDRAAARAERRAAWEEILTVEQRRVATVHAWLRTVRAGRAGVQGAGRARRPGRGPGVGFFRG